MRILHRFLFFVLAVSTILPAHARDRLNDIGVILIHGKLGAQGPLQPLARDLTAEGAIVLMPRMSWASGEYRTYKETLGEIAEAVQQARSMGARKIVLAGHSLGSNVSFGYAAAGGRVDAIVAMAPGHRPELIQRVAGDSLARAKAMSAAGQGSQRASFIDANQGRAYSITTTADAYISFFDPRGPAGQAAQGRGGNSVLWVVGRFDESAMRDPASRSRGTRIEVDAGHGNTPVVAAPLIVHWLKNKL